jgi:soluble lytic murein transglycosylase-like protein
MVAMGETRAVVSGPAAHERVPTGPLLCTIAATALIFLSWAISAQAHEEGGASLAGFSYPTTHAAASRRAPADCGEVVRTRHGYRALATCQAAWQGLPPHVAHAVIEIESGYHEAARGGDGEIGLMQVLPSTARMLGFRGTLDELSEPENNVRFGVRYLAEAWRLAAGDLCTALMKYRAGHGETRFSVLSVRYCDRARQILQREGIKVTGTLPEATFGFAAGSPSWTGGSKTANAKAKGVCVRRHLVPGPRYRSCAEYRSKAKARQIVALRARLFDG